MSDSTRCNRCDNRIFFKEINGKCYAFEDEYGITLHKCPYSSKTNSNQERIETLEKIVRKLNDKITLQEEKIRELSQGRF